MLASGAEVFDVAVAGLGGMGSAVAAHAAARGLRVLGIEQYAELHDRGSSAGESRIIRKAYFEDPAYVPLLLRAYELWRRLETQTQKEILCITGMLLIGAVDSETLHGARRSAQVHGLALQALSSGEVRARFPQFRIRPGEEVLFEPDAGFVRPEEAIRAHLAVARANGAVLCFDTGLNNWEPHATQGVRLQLRDGHTIAARKLVLCTGAWFAGDPRALGVPVRVQRNVQMWFAAGELFARGSLPVFFADRRDYPKPLYGFPDIGNGLKAAFHGYGESTTPEGLRRNVDADEIAVLRSALDDLLPGAAGALTATKTCMYSLTPDEHFVVGRYPGCDGVLVAGGFSGHGYKFCSVIGEIVADLLERGETRHDIGFLSPLRFKRA